MDNINALILAAGKGLRLQNRFNCSKPMVPILGKPLITFIIDSLIHCGIENINIVYHPSNSDILNLTKTNKVYSECIRFLENKEQQGLLSDIDFASKEIDMPCIISGADIIVQKEDFKEMLQYGLNMKSQNPDLLVPIVNSPSILNETPFIVKNDRIIKWNLHSRRNDSNAGGEAYFWYETPFPLVKKLISSGIQDWSIFMQTFIKKHKVFVMPIKDMWDVDTPEDVTQTENILLNRKIDRRD
jgi:NDP-sugar pyrophosphorylase family protein